MVAAAAVAIDTAAGTIKIFNSRKRPRRQKGKNATDAFDREKKNKQEIKRERKIKRKSEKKRKRQGERKRGERKSQQME